MKLKLNLINLIDNFNETNLNKIKNDYYLLNIIDNIKNPSYANQKLGLSFFTILLIPIILKNMFLQNSINFSTNILDLFLTILLSFLTYDYIKFRFIEYKINKSNNFKELYHLSVKIIAQYIIHIEKTDLFLFDSIYIFNDNILKNERNNKIITNKEYKNYFFKNITFLFQDDIINKINYNKNLKINLLENKHNLLNNSYNSYN